MKLNIRKEEGKSIYMDWYYGTEIFLIGTTIIFYGNNHAKTVVLRGIDSSNFDEYNTGYLDGKMTENGVSVKDRKFYQGMLEHYKKLKNKLDSKK